MTNRHAHIPELLAPAGGPAAFYAAVAGGADAIYCGLGSDFNARRGAGNFTEDEFRAACRAAHLAGTRVYVTVNVVIKQQEMPAALALVKRAWELGADAFIIQDWGLLARIQELWPQVECHISTQANVHDTRGVAWCRSLGADRVTLSRELSLDEIAAIHAQELAATQAGERGCELEVFGHGALCFCYSGICMMSSMRALTDNVRSANRGMCAQPCRLPYDLVNEVGELLSAPGRTRPLCPKDACMVGSLAQMADAGVASLKIEGRMKAPDYVYSVISTYREALNALAGSAEDAAGASAATGDELLASGEAAWRERLRRAFNRDFTDAYLQGTSGDEMMSYERSNNRGSVVGEVLESRELRPERKQTGGANGGRTRQKTVVPAQTTIRLSSYVEKGDLLEIRHPDDVDAYLTAPAREDAQAGDVISVRTARPMPTGAVVRAIRSQRALDEAAQVVSRAEAGAAVRKRAVDAHVVARIGSPLRIQLSCEVLPSDTGARGGEASQDDEPLRMSVCVEGDTAEPARTRAVSAADLEEHVGRMGSSPFELRSFACDLDEGVGMSFSSVHELRAQACDALSGEILSAWEGRALVLPRRAKSSASDVQGAENGSQVTATSRLVSGGNAVTPMVAAQVSTPSAARAALAAGATHVYAEADDIAAQEGWPEGVIPILSEVCREVDHVRMDAHVAPGARALCSSVSELALAQESGTAAEIASCIPVHNSYAADVLVRKGADTIWLSPEVSLAEMEELLGECARSSESDSADTKDSADVDIAATSAAPVFGLKIYGYERLMTSEHCVLQAADRCIHDCERCPLRKQKLFLRDENGELLPVSTDREGRSRIYLSKPFDGVPQVKELLSAGVSRFLVDGTLLSDVELEAAIRRTADAVDAAVHGGRMPKRLPDTVSGHLFTPIL